MYKLYTDKIENFEAKIELSGASLKQSKARLVIESADFDLMFKGTITSDGNVKVPVKQLRGLIDENTKGTIKLEIIAEDTYFVPWESTFEVETSKKVTVEVKSQKQTKLIESKSSVEILSQIEPTLSERQHILNIVKMLVKENINIKNLHIKKNKLNNIVAEYIQGNTIAENQKAPVINKVIKVLQKRQ
jgi:hypothetical protein